MVSSSPTTNPARTLSLAFAALLTCAAGATLLVQYLQWSSVPPDEDWKNAAESTRKHITSDDAFLVEPEWDSRPRQWMDTHTYVPAQDVLWSDVAPYKRLFILSETTRLDNAKARLPKGWTITKTLPSPQPSTISVLEAHPPDPNPVLWDILSSLKDAKIWRTYPDPKRKRQDCTRFVPTPLPSWYCGRRDPFLYVGEALRTLPNDTHRCLWAMPIDARGTLHIQMKDVPLGTELHGHYGQPIDAIRSKRGAPVHFEIALNETILHTKTFTLHEEGFPMFSVDTSAYKGTTQDLTFRVHSDNQVDRFFCFTARTSH